MQRTRIPSPARSQGATTTPRRKKARSSRSLCSPALSTASGRLTSIIDQFKDKNMESFALSPLNGKSVLNDNTDIEEPRRKSWWKKLDENSRDVLEVLEDNKLSEVNNAVEEFIDIDVLSQEKKNYTLDLPESSDNESIHSIVLPQRRLFTQKENLPQKKFGQLIDNRESLAKLHKPNTTNTEKTVNVGTRELFQTAKRSKPIFPSALLNISPNKTVVDKTKENVLVEPKPQVRSIFGNRPANKRKNMFADFIVSESEDEIPEIQPKVFGFQKKLEQRRISSISKGREGSPTSSITTDMEMDDWKMLPSSTMVENQIEDMMGGNTPVKRARLSKLSEAKESDAGTNTLQTNTTADKTKQSNKSVFSSKNKSKASPEVKNASLNNSRTTRSMLKNASKVEENVNTSLKQDSKGSQTRSPKVDSNKSLQNDKQNISLNKSQKLNKSKTRNSEIVLEDNVEADENIFNTIPVINNLTRVINKSTGKNMSSSTVPNKSVNEKERTVTLKVHSKVGAEDMEQDQEDDENNFTLQYENDENEIIEEAVDHNDLAESQKDKKQNTTLIKDSQETQLNKSKNNKSNLSNKSIQKVMKPTKTVEESVESQNEQYSADDHVDGNVEQDPETVHDKTEVHEEEIEVANMNEASTENVADQSEVDDANVSHDNDDEQNVSQEANNSQEVENEENESEEEEAVDSDENEEASDLNVGDANESQEVEVEVNDQANESHMDEDNDASENEDEEKTANESHVEEANQSQEADNDEEESEEVENDEESQEVENEAEVSQEVQNDEEESQEVENDEESQEIENDEEESQEVENDEEESQEVENDEEKSQEIENDEEHEQIVSDAEANESEENDDDQQMEDSDEADKAIASDPEISEQDDNDDPADEMEVDDDNDEQESVHDQSHQEERQIEEQNEVEPSAEEIGESPDVTHDTTGRHRKKHLNKSPEVILLDKTTQMDSFTATGRNTSIRKTKSMIKNLHITPSLAPPRNSTGFSDGTTNSSAEGSGWDSHRTTRKTLRQTFGKDFTPRKSLRAMVMEKSAKRQTEHIDMHSETVKFPQANSTELPEMSHRDDVEDFVESDHEVSRRTRQTTLETYLEKIKLQNIEKKAKMEELVRNSLNKGPVRDPLSLFKVPNKPAPRRPKPSQAKPKKQIRSIIAFDDLPSEMKEDMKYKPPKRFQPSNASWITKRLYKFLETKLEPKYDYKARIRSEKLVETIYHFAKDLRRHNVAPTDAVDVLKHELARLEVVRTHFEFYEFFHEFMPREVRIKVVPDIVNKIPLPRHGVFSEILRGNTVQG